MVVIKVIIFGVAERDWVEIEGRDKRYHWSFLYLQKGTNWLQEVVSIMIRRNMIKMADMREDASAHKIQNLAYYETKCFCWSMSRCSDTTAIIDDGLKVEYLGEYRHET